MNIQNKNVHDDFNTFFTTLIFVLLNIGTFGIYGYYWIISASITANKKYGSVQKNVGSHSGSFQTVIPFLP